MAMAMELVSQISKLIYSAKPSLHHRPLPFLRNSLPISGVAIFSLLLLCELSKDTKGKLRFTATDLMAYANMAITGRKKMSKPAKTAITERAKKSKCVRLDDRKGNNWKFNKTNFQCPVRRELYYFIVKCYEQILRRKSPDSVAVKQRFQLFRRFLEYLKPLPEDFEKKSDTEKREVLKKLFDEVEDEAAAALAREGHQDMGMSVNNSEIIPRDEGQAADITPDIVQELPYDNSLQNVALDQPDHPHGRPPPHPRVHLYGQCECELGNLKRRAFRFPDLSASFEVLEQKFKDELTDRELAEALKDDKNSRLRIRLEEIHESLEVDLKS